MRECVLVEIMPIDVLQNLQLSYFSNKVSSIFKERFVLNLSLCLFHFRTKQGHRLCTTSIKIHQNRHFSLPVTHLMMTSRKERICSSNYAQLVVGEVRKGGFIHFFGPKTDHRTVFKNGCTYATLRLHKVSFSSVCCDARVCDIMAVVLLAGAMCQTCIKYA